MAPPKAANAHSYTDKQKEVAVPRPSASLVIVNPKNEVLLVHRTRSASTFANAHVFPGGNMDAQDSSSFEFCAIRETFEESGLLLTTTPVNPSIDLADIRKQIHGRKLRFDEFLKREGLVADVGKLIPFSTWITPATMKKRFHTRMFLTFLAEPAEGTEMTLPTHDGGIETVETIFHPPSKALDIMLSGKMVLFPPQAYLLTRLVPHLDIGGSNVQGEKNVRRWLSEEKVGEYVFRPRPEGRTKDGRVILGYGPDADPKFKAVLTTGKGGMPAGVEILELAAVAKL